MRLHRSPLTIGLGIAVALTMVLMLAACGESTPQPTNTPATAATPTVAGTTVPGTTPTPVSTRPSATATPAPTATQAPKVGGTLKWVSLSAVNRADPHATYGASDIWALPANSTVRLNPKDLSVYADLAESWEYKTPTELVIKYKRGIRFQQESLAKGREMTSDDVVASLTRALRKTAPLGSGTGFPTVSKYEVVDQNTVKVTFSAPDANYLFSLALPGPGVILPKEFVDKYPDKLMAEDGYFGTGPFVFDQSAYRADVSGAFNKNPRYDVRPGQPYLDRVEWIFIADASSRTAALRTGQVDIGIVPTLERDTFAKSGFILTSTADNTITVQHLAMNTTIYPTNDVRVRRAINIAIDREELRAVVADGFGCVAIIFGCKSDWFLTEKDYEGKPGFRTNKAQDYTEAKALLKEAGFDPSSMNLILASGLQSQFKVQFAQALALTGMLQRNLGLKVTHMPLAGNQGSSVPGANQTREGGFHMVNVGYGGLGNYIIDSALSAAFIRTATQNDSLWDDPKTEALYQAERSAVDPKERKKLLQEAQTYLMGDTVLPVAPTVRDYVAYGTTPRVKGWDGTGVYFTGIYAWQLQWTWVDK